MCRWEAKILYDNCCHAESFTLISQHWDDSGCLNHVIMSNNCLFIMNSQYHGFWWPDEQQSHGTSNHTIGQFTSPFYPNLSWYLRTTMIQNKTQPSVSFMKYTVCYSYHRVTWSWLTFGQSNLGLMCCILWKINIYFYSLSFHCANVVHLVEIPSHRRQGSVYHV